MLFRSDDARGAKTGFQGLASLAGFDPSIRAFISPPALAKLAGAYSVMSEKGQIANDKALSSLLGELQKEKQ